MFQLPIVFLSSIQNSDNQPERHVSHWEFQVASRRDKECLVSILSNVECEKFQRGNSSKSFNGVLDKTFLGKVLREQRRGRSLRTSLS